MLRILLTVVNKKKNNNRPQISDLSLPAWWLFLLLLFFLGYETRDYEERSPHIGHGNLDP